MFIIVYQHTYTIQGHQPHYINIKRLVYNIRRISVTRSATSNGRLFYVLFVCESNMYRCTWIGDWIEIRLCESNSIMLSSNSRASQPAVNNELVMFINTFINCYNQYSTLYITKTYYFPAGCFWCQPISFSGNFTAINSE